MKLPKRTVGVCKGFATGDRRMGVTFLMGECRMQNQKGFPGGGEDRQE